MSSKNKDSSKNKRYNNSSIDKLNKLDKLILKLDYLENKVISAPSNINKHIQIFIKNNKYILIAISALILASIGYSTYNLIKSADTSTVKLRKTIDNIYKIIESDDSVLNDSQKIIKYFYLYNIRVPFSEYDKEKMLEFYNKNANNLLTDLTNKAKPILINDILPAGLDKVKSYGSDTAYNAVSGVRSTIANTVSGVGSSISNTVSGVGSSVSNTVSDTASSVSTIANYLGSFFVSDIYSKYKNKDVLFKCYESIREKPNMTFEEFIQNFDMAETLFKDKLDNCYNDVSVLLDKYNNQDKVKECIPKNYTNIYKNDLLHFLVYNVNNLSSFEDCYNDDNKDVFYDNIL